MADLKVFPGAGNPDQLAATLRQVIQETPTHMLLQVEMAKLARNKYEELIKVGFSEYQALEIVKVNPY